MPKLQPKTFKDLTSSQRDRFEARIKRHGIPRERVPKKIVAEGKFVVHRDPARSSQQTHGIIIKNLAELKELGGIPDSRYVDDGYSDVFIDYPPPIPDDRLRVLKATRFERAGLLAAMTAAEQDMVQTAMNAYSLGDTHKVAQEWVDIANATNFPMEASTVAAEDLVIKGEYLIAGPGPVDLTFGTVTIEPGGYITCLVPCTFNSQIMTRQ